MMQRSLHRLTGGNDTVKVLRQRNTRHQGSQSGSTSQRRDD